MGKDQEILRVVLRRIEADTNSHTEHLADLHKAGTLRSAEAGSLQAFEGFLTHILEKFDELTSPSPERPADRKPPPSAYSCLLLTYFYTEIESAIHVQSWGVYDGVVVRTVEMRWRSLVGALLAAEVETHGKFRMGRSKSSQIAAVFKDLGEGFRNADLPQHAAYAFDRAAELYRSLRLTREENICMLLKRRAEHEALPPGLLRRFDYVLDVVSGYGYRPFRLVRLVLLELALYTLIVWAATPRTVDPVWAGENVLLDFLNPTGPTSAMRGSGNLFLLVDSYSGYITLTLMFALLVRHF